jgi:hypothetical protein
MSKKRFVWEFPSETYAYIHLLAKGNKETGYVEALGVFVLPENSKPELEIYPKEPSNLFNFDVSTLPENSQFNCGSFLKFIRGSDTNFNTNVWIVGPLGQSFFDTDLKLDLPRSDSPLEHYCPTIKIAHITVHMVCSLWCFLFCKKYLFQDACYSVADFPGGSRASAQAYQDKE